jgi:hypothetical protein
LIRRWVVREKWEVRENSVTKEKPFFRVILKPNRTAQKKGDYFAYRYRDGTTRSGWIVQPTFGTDWHINF